MAGYRLPGQAAAVRRTLGVVSHLPLLYGDLTAEENLCFLWANVWHIRSRPAHITSFGNGRPGFPKTRPGENFFSWYAATVGNWPGGFT